MESQELIYIGHESARKAIEKTLTQNFYFSKSEPVLLNSGLICFQCFDDRNKPSEYYYKLLLRFPSLFTLNRVDNEISIDIRQITDYSFYYKKLYKRGNDTLVIKLVYCLNIKLNKFQWIGKISELNDYIIYPDFSLVNLSFFIDIFENQNRYEFESYWNGIDLQVIKELIDELFLQNELFKKELKKLEINKKKQKDSELEKTKKNQKKNKFNLFRF